MPAGPNLWNVILYFSTTKIKFPRAPLIARLPETLLMIQRQTDANTNMNVWWSNVWKMEQCSFFLVMRWGCASVWHFNKQFSNKCCSLELCVVCEQEPVSPHTYATAMICQNVQSILSILMLNKKIDMLPWISDFVWRCCGVTVAAVSNEKFAEVLYENRHHRPQSCCL